MRQCILFLSVLYTRELGILAGITGCICFADTRLAMQQEDRAFAFPGYEVGCPGFVGWLIGCVGFILVILCQRFDQAPSLVFYD